MNLQRLLEKRTAAVAELDRVQDLINDILTRVKSEGREELTSDETSEYKTLRADLLARQREVKNFNERIQEIYEDQARAGDLNADARAIRKAQMTSLVVTEPKTYTKNNGCSYFQDLMRHQLGMDSDGSAAGRLRRHAQDVAEGREYRDLDRVDGNGGYFTPPAHLVNQYAPVARAGRPFANIVQNLPLAAGISSISIPRVTSGTAVGMQTADNAPVQETDLEDDAIEAKVQTVAGQQDIAIQLLDQSPVSFDDVIFQDLLADYAVKVDVQVLRGTGLTGQVKGVHATPGIETIPIDTLTLPAFYGAVADGIQRVHTMRHQAPSHIAVHPRRWAWLNAQLDDDNRPLVVPSAQAPQNAVASFSGVISEGIVGTMQGLPVLADPNIGTTYGDDDNEDVVYVVRSSDMLLYESGIRTRVLNEVGSGNLTVRLQVYGYILFTAERYPKSVVEIGGLTEPVFV